MDQPTPLTFLDDTGTGFTIEQDGTPVGPAVSTLDVVGATVTYDEPSDTHTLAVTGTGGTGDLVTVSPLAGGGALSSDLTLSISAATPSLPGSMSAADKTKLDGLPSSAVPTTRTLTTTSPVTIDGAGSADLSANRTLALSVGGANTVLYSNGTTDTWMGNPIVTSLTATNQLVVGTGNIGVLQNDTWGPYGTDANISTLAGIAIKVQGTPVASFDATSADVKTHPIINVVDPTNPQDAATKHYVDSVAVGLQIKGAVAVVSTSNISSLSGLATTVDGVLLNVDSTRVLLTGQSTASQNGIYLVHSGAWTRSTDMAAGSHAAGSFAFITGGTVYGNTGWVCSTLGPNDVVGTNNLTFTEFSAAGQVIAGAGLLKTGSTIDIVAADGTITVNADSIQVGIITNANISGSAAIAWSKLTGYPTITCTAPLTIDGGASADLSTNRTLALSVGAANSVLASNGSADSFTTTPTVTSLTALAGLTVGSTTPTITFTNASTSPSLSQADNTTNSATGQPLTVSAQNCTGTTTTGGTLNLASGTGTSANGYVSLLSGAATIARWSIFGSQGYCSFDVSLTAANIKFANSNSAATGAPLTIAAQNTSATTSTGGDLNLKSGIGTSTPGNVNLYNGSTTNLTLSQPATGIPNCNFSGTANWNDIAIQAAPAAGEQQIQAYNGQMIFRAGGGYSDRAITYGNVTGTSTKAPRVQKYCSPYTQTAPATTTQVIGTSIFGQAPPANRELYGILTLVQRVDTVATSGSAAMYLLTGVIESSGNLNAMYISSAIGAVGPGIAPDVTVQVVSNTQFSFQIYNSAYAGVLTGYWQLEYGWVGA